MDANSQNTAQATSLQTEQLPIDQNCINNALFISPLPVAYPALFFVFIPIGSVFLVIFAHDLFYKGFMKESCIVPDQLLQAETTLAVATSQETNNDNLSTLPPAYAETTETNSTPSPPPPATHKYTIRNNSALIFVIGTTILICLAFIAFLFILSIQHVRYCDKSKPDESVSRVTNIILWILFTILALIDSTAICLWINMLIFLWKRPSKNIQVVIPEHGIILAITLVILSPILVPLYYCVKVIEISQKKYCPERLQDLDQIELEAAVDADGEPAERCVFPETNNREQSMEEDEVLESAALLYTGGGKQI